MKKLLLIVPALLCLSGCDWFKSSTPSTPSIQSNENTPADTAAQPAPETTDVVE